MKIKDGGGAPGEAAVALAIARRTRALLLARGYRVAMTRTGPTFRYGTRRQHRAGQFCNRRHAALMLRIHADGSPDPSLHGVSTLVPGPAPRLDGRHLRAEPARGRVSSSGRSSRATGAADRGSSPRAT